MNDRLPKTKDLLSGMVGAVISIPERDVRQGKVNAGHLLLAIN